jgi:hypothetical protein
MYADWTSHLDNTEKENFEKSVFASRRVLDRLRALLEIREKSMDRYENGLKQFENPNWAERQAFQNGIRSEREYLKKLINLDQQEIKDQL